MTPSSSTNPIPPQERPVRPRAAGRRFWLWQPISQGVARSNAQTASVDMAKRRAEREDVEDYLARRGP
jgi:hypothetical protein